MSNRRIAILIDGAFFLKRLPALVGEANCDSPEKVRNLLWRLCRSHIAYCTGDKSPSWLNQVHRLFYYDAVPFNGKAHHPIDNRSIDFARSDVARFRLRLFELLKRQRKVALRLGKVNKESDWVLHASSTKKLLKTRAWIQPLNRLGDEAALDQGEPAHLTLSVEEACNLIKLREVWTSLDSGSVTLGLKQKGVDMRIGMTSRRSP